MLDDDAPNRRRLMVPSSKSNQVWHARKVKRPENIFQRKSAVARQKIATGCIGHNRRF
jgi:hypothetical protein